LINAILPGLTSAPLSNLTERPAEFFLKQPPGMLSFLPDIVIAGKIGVDMPHRFIDIIRKQYQ
jgi:hypothetical protein